MCGEPPLETSSSPIRMMSFSINDTKTEKKTETNTKKKKKTEKKQNTSCLETRPSPDG